MLSNEEFQELSEVKKQEINMLVDRYTVTPAEDINQRLILALDIMEEYRKYTASLRNRVRILKGIDLRNVDLGGISIDEEISKFHEELKEVMSVINNKDLDSSINHATEELFDMLQVGLGLIQLKYKKDAENVMRLYQYHLIKLENRPRVKED